MNLNWDARLDNESNIATPFTLVTFVNN